MTDDVLYAPDIARIRGCSRVTAWRWLNHIDPKFTVRKGLRGRIVGITRANLEALSAGMPAPIDDRIGRRLADLEERMQIAEGRADVLADDLRRLKRATDPLF